MRSVDVIVLFACVVVILFSFQEEWRGGNATVELSWSIPIDVRHFSNGHFPNRIELLADPLIVDIDGDGQREVIVASSDNKIRIYDAGQLNLHHLNSEGLPEPAVRAEASTQSAFGGKMNKRAVAMAVGSIGTLLESSNILVVVTNDFTVMCFNSKLKLLWESHVREHLSGKHYLSEVSITISPQPIRVDDKGAVFVGGRLRKRIRTKFTHDHQKEEGDETGVEGEPVFDEETDDYELDYDDRNEDLQDDEETERKRQEDEEEEHFSYYAFDGRTGAQIWKHEANDFLDSSHEEGVHELSHLEELLPSHSVKLNAIRALVTRHMGQVDWREHRASFMAQLPHVWRHPKDTFLAPAAFKRPRQIGRGSSSSTSSSSSFSSSSFGTSLFGGATSTSENSWKPNVLVAHSEKGLEVVHYYTGRTLCSLNLFQGSFADVNADGMVDHLYTTAKDSNQQFYCTGVATTGIPPTMDLWSVPICGQFTNGWFGKLYRHDISKDEEEGELDRIAATAPVVIPATKTSSAPGINFGSSSGHGQLLDTIFFVSSGWVTSVGPLGKTNWEIKTEAIWPLSEREEEVMMDSMLVSDPTHEVLPPHFPSLSILDIGGGAGRAILAIGKSLVLLSVDGDVMATVPIPETRREGDHIMRGFPIAPPTMGDFNNDGSRDIILHSSNAFYGFTVRSKMNYPVVPMLGFGLLVVLGIVAYQNNRASSSSSSYSKAGKRN